MFVSECTYKSMITVSFHNSVIVCAFCILEWTEKITENDDKLQRMYEVISSLACHIDAAEKLVEDSNKLLKLCVQIRVCFLRDNKNTTWSKKETGIKSWLRSILCRA